MPAPSPAARRPARVLVTGGAGLIGTHLVRLLQARGIETTVLDDLSSPAEGPGLPPGVGFVQGSVLDAELVDRLVREHEAVFHLAAVVGVRRVLLDPVRGLEVNTTGTTRVLEACTKHRRRVLYTSSSEVYGRGFASPFRETDPLVLGPPHVSRWSYALAKLHGESLGFELARRDGLSFVATRMFNVVGPGQRADQGMVLPNFVANVRAGRPVRVYAPGTQRRCFMHARDASAILLRLMLEGPEEALVVNVGSSESVSMLELAERVIARAGGGAIELVHPQDVLPPGFEEVPDRVPELSRLTSLLGPQNPAGLDAIVSELVGLSRAPEQAA